MTHYDAIVVGAGPAGSTAAREIASRGHFVLLLDRAEFPRDKPCGGGVTVRCAALLPFDLSPVVEHVVSGAMIGKPHGPVITRDAGRVLTYMTQRRHLDAFLVARAQDAGVDFRDRHAVRSIVEHPDGTFEVTAAPRPGSSTAGAGGDSHTGRVLIGADGANGVVGTFLGFEHIPEHAVALEGNLPYPDGLPEWIRGRVHLSLGLLPGGYGWVFPKGDHVNIGVGGWKGIAGDRLRETLDNYSRDFGWDPAQLEHLRGHHLPMQRPGQEMTARAVALVGDAAGLVDPLSGEGITAAVASGIAVAAPADDYLRGRTRDLAAYQYIVERELLPDLVASRALMEVFHAWPGATTYLAMHSDRLWRRFTALLRGEQTYSSIVASTGPIAPTLAPLAALARRLTTAKYGARE
jgi:geranylgeranyl reductase family protein